MRRIIVALLLIFLAGFGAYRYYFQEIRITNYPAKQGPIVAFGDSLVYGVGSTQGNDFVSQLSEKIGEPIINMGVSGNTTAQALKRLPDALEKEPKIALVLVGGNDFLQKVPQQETFSNLERIIEGFQGQGTLVVLLGVRGGLLHDIYESQFEELAQKTGAAYVPDVLDGLIGKKELMSDAVHPNDAGYALIAERVYPVLKKVLN